MGKLSELRDIIAKDWGYENDWSMRRRIEIAIIPARATILQRRYDQTRKFPTFLKQTVIAELKLVEFHNQQFRRTVNKVPNPLIVRDESGFDYVGDVNLSRGFDYIEQYKVELQRFKKFGANRPYYFDADGYIYVGNATGLGNVALRGVFENPIKVKQFGNCLDNNCFDETGEFIIEDSLFDPIFSLLKDRRPEILNQPKQDEVDV